MNEEKQYQILTFLILFMITLSSSIIYAEENKEKFNSFKLDPLIYSPTPGIKFIERFNLTYSPDKNCFCIKGRLYPKEKWNVTSVIRFQFYIDPNYALRETKPESVGIHEANLPLKEELSFLATDYNQGKWVNKTCIRDFHWFYDPSHSIHYKIDLNSNKKFYNALKEQDKSIYFEIYFDFNNCKINGTKLDMSGKKEIYLLLPAYKFQSNTEESVSFALKFEGKIIDDYNPKENIVIDDNRLKCTFDSPNYRETNFYVHLTLNDPLSWWEGLNLWANSNLGIIVLVLGIISVSLGALSFWIALKNRNDKNPIMKHENMSIKKISVGISISAIFLIFIRLIWPNLNIDWITITLIVIAIIPWIAPLLKSLEIPGGWKIEFRDVKNASEKVTSGKKFEIAKKRDFITLEPIIKHDPSLALVYLRIEIEKRVRKLAEKYNVGTERDSLGHLLRTLHYHKVLPANVFSGLKELVILGNKAAHGTKVSLDAAEWALDSGPRILRVLDDILNKKENGKQERKQK